MLNPTAVSPRLVAFISLNIDATTNSGSWGYSSITQLVPATSWTILLSQEFAGLILVGNIAKQLHITVSTKEGAATTAAITPVANGFTLTMGAALTQPVTIKVEKLISE